MNTDVQEQQPVSPANTPAGKDGGKKKLFVILWIVLAALLIASVVFVVVSVEKQWGRISAAQDHLLANLPDSFFESGDDTREERIQYLHYEFDYLVRNPNYSDSEKLKELRRDVRDDLNEILEKGGYDSTDFQRITEYGNKSEYIKYYTTRFDNMYMIIITVVLMAGLLVVNILYSKGKIFNKTVR